MPKFLRDDSIKITVSTASVSDAQSFGYVARGSVIFNVAELVEGYAISAIQFGEPILTVYCPAPELDNYIQRVKYELSKKYSVVMTIKK